jgi:hypothetical protein
VLHLSSHLGLVFHCSFLWPRADYADDVCVYCSLTYRGWDWPIDFYWRHDDLSSMSDVCLAYALGMGSLFVPPVWGFDLGFGAGDDDGGAYPSFDRRRVLSWDGGRSFQTFDAHHPLLCGDHTRDVESVSPLHSN